MLRDKPVTILVAEAVQFIRAGLVGVLSQQPDISVIGQVADGFAALRDAHALHPNVLVMNIELSGIDGIEILRRIKLGHPEVRVLIFTTHDTDEYLFAALAAGADGYCLKGVTSQSLVLAVLTVAAGAFWLDPSLTRRVLDAAVRGLSQDGGDTKSPYVPESLSDRELEVLSCLGMGLSNQQIADRFELSIETVKTHLQRIYKKLALTHRTQAAIYAVRSGLAPHG